MQFFLSFFPIACSAVSITMRDRETERGNMPRAFKTRLVSFLPRKRWCARCQTRLARASTISSRKLWATFTRDTFRMYFTNCVRQLATSYAIDEYICPIRMARKAILNFDDAQRYAASRLSFCGCISRRDPDSDRNYLASCEMRSWKNKIPHRSSIVRYLHSSVVLRCLYRCV